MRSQAKSLRSEKTIKDNDSGKDVQNKRPIYREALGNLNRFARKHQRRRSGDIEIDDLSCAVEAQYLDATGVCLLDDGSACQRQRPTDGNRTPDAEHARSVNISQHANLFETVGVGDIERVAVRETGLLVGLLPELLVQAKRFGRAVCAKNRERF